MNDIHDARALLVLGDSITTDHISPAGQFNEFSSAGEYLISRGVKKANFNSYGSRRGNDEVMLRGTFANVRIKNKLAQKEGGYTGICLQEKKCQFMMLRLNTSKHKRL